jgi:peroxiredoxin
MLFMEVQMALKIGDEAPDFRLSSTTGPTQGEFQLSAYRGQNVVICFYALDFTPV